MDKFLRNKLNHCLISLTSFTGLTGLKKPAARKMVMVAITMTVWVVTGALNKTAAADLNLTKNLNSLSDTHTQLTNSDPNTDPNNDPFNMDLRDTYTGTAEKHITCYPNPAISYINFKFDKSVPKDARLFVFSFTGKKMEEQAITGQLLKITLDNYYRGLYVYQLRSAGGAILESGKFQVKN